MTVASTTDQPLPLDTEERLAEFTELVATAIANAESRAELAASRARIVATADAARRRIERDLHDGAQQQLVSVALRLRTAAAAIPPEEEVQQELAGIGSELDDALADLRELSRGIHPAILSEGGLGPALRTLARRSSVPVELQVGTEGRLPERIEVAAYYVVAEALANVAKHAGASVVQVDVDADDGLLRLAIRDDGVGGADPARGPLRRTGGCCPGPDSEPAGPASPRTADRATLCPPRRPHQGRVAKALITLAWSSCTTTPPGSPGFPA